MSKKGAFDTPERPVSDVQNKEIFAASVRIEPEDITQLEAIWFDHVHNADAAPVIHAK